MSRSGDGAKGEGVRGHAGCSGGLQRGQWDQLCQLPEVLVLIGVGVPTPIGELSY